MNMVRLDVHLSYLSAQPIRKPLNTIIDILRMIPGEYPVMVLRSPDNVILQRHIVCDSLRFFTFYAIMRYLSLVQLVRSPNEN